MIRDLGMAKQRLVAIQTCLLTWTPYCLSTQVPPNISLNPEWLPQSFPACDETPSPTSPTLGFIPSAPSS